MRIILGCDPLLAPLTGIGHYTNEVAKRLDKSDKIEALKLFAHAKFFDTSLLQTNRDNVETAAVDYKTPLLQTVRTQLAKSELAVKLYSVIEPVLSQQKLKPYNDFLFHSPNFILPRFEGKKVVTIHDLSTFKYPEFHPKARVNIVNKAIEQAVMTADHIVTDSELIKSEIVDYFSVPAHKVTSIHLGVGTDYYPRRDIECQGTLSRYGLSYKKFFIFVSTIEPRKNVLGILDGYSKYRQRHPEGIPLILIGGKGWNSKAEHEKIKEMESKGWIKYLGYVGQSELPELVASAKAMIFPSLYEGFGLPVAEAIASSTHVLTSKGSAMEEFAGSGVQLVNPWDVDAIADGIENLAVNSEPTSVKEQHDHRFDWDITVEKLIDLYAKVIME